ncbi:Fis family transcriptional regulator [Kribbella qitaiheensis]|uniref:Fis family transcriptional regulator n=1 Tax=Kribbella qitaiheensis TaxID=1544730 RepID=A0A7G6WSC5_9ACTN|nr:GAF domain-containing protein [Kribbella qitaiheensis]QNE16890.1 Fis family transcriptional regulator [Kribbella qitaiheensis]
MDELAPVSGDSSRLAEARLSFLTYDAFPVGDVRRPVLASWVRSRRWNLPADRIDLPYVADPELDVPLTRSATPVLRRLHEHLAGQPISVILTERNGMVLRRLTDDAELSRHLDRVNLAPGFSYSEQFAGTNGIGTALERGGPMHVFGHEHYAEDLEDLACAGVPIKHPISGKTVGAIDLTCWRKDAGSLLIALAKTTADQIRAALLSDSSAREQELLQEYLLAGRRSGDMVLAVNDDLLLMNTSAQQNLDASDQAAVLAHAADILAQTAGSALAVELPSGRRVRITCRAVPADGRGAAAVIQITRQTTGPGSASFNANRPPSRPELPGIVGRSAPWLATSRTVDNAYRAGQWIVLTGERGTGKVALARAAHQQNNRAGSFHLVDAAESPDHIEAELADDTVQALVIRHAERLVPARLDELVGALHSGRERRLSEPPWVALTLTTGDSTEPDLGELLTVFPITVDVPSLRHHIDDIRELVPHFLSQLSHGDLTCSPEAMHQLLRSAWPGNIADLQEVLKQVVHHRRRTGVITPSDLPPDLQTRSRRSLSQLEALERDAIIHSLLDNNGNRRDAAKSLGMSRATIYRKIHDYGIR